MRIAIADNLLDVVPTLGELPIGATFVRSGGGHGSDGGCVEAAIKISFSEGDFDLYSEDEESIAESLEAYGRSAYVVLATGKAFIADNDTQVVPLDAYVAFGVGEN